LFVTVEVVDRENLAIDCYSAAVTGARVGSFTKSFSPRPD